VANQIGQEWDHHPDEGIYSSPGHGALAPVFLDGNQRDADDLI
jgi:hypothetical protein